MVPGGWTDQSSLKWLFYLVINLFAVMQEATTAPTTNATTTTVSNNNITTTTAANNNTTTTPTLMTTGRKSSNFSLILNKEHDQLLCPVWRHNFILFLNCMIIKGSMIFYITFWTTSSLMALIQFYFTLHFFQTQETRTRKILFLLVFIRLMLWATLLKSYTIDSKSGLMICQTNRPIDFSLINKIS